jgi:peptide/nickel transport system permease protein
MAKFVVRRLLMLIPTLLGIILLSFLIFKLTPGDPAQIMLQGKGTSEQVAVLREQMGLNQPVPVQFGLYLWRLLHGDLGKSFFGGFPVRDAIMSRLPSTLELAFAAMAFAIVVGIGVGTLAATSRSRALDNVLMTFTLGGLAIPQYWLAAVFIIVFAVMLKWVPVLSGSGPKYLILPAICLGIAPAASMARLTRSSILDVLHNDFTRTARAKGLSERTVITRHVLRNALIPILTVTGLWFGSLLGGAVFVETAFGRPGIGTFAVAAINNRDYPQIQGTILIGALFVVLVNLIVDVLYGFADPRMRQE